MEQAAASVARYLAALDTADRHDPGVPTAKVQRLREKLDRLHEQMRDLREMEKVVAASPDRQVSLTDPDARAMTTSGRGSTVVGYNVQAAVDTTHHLIVPHEVTNATSDRAQLATMAMQAQEATGRTALTVLADRGYFAGRQIVACEKAGMMTYVPKPYTSGAKADRPGLHLGPFGAAGSDPAQDQDHGRAGRRAVDCRRRTGPKAGYTISAARSGACSMRELAMPRDWDLGGVFLAPFIGQLVIALLILLVIRATLGRVGFGTLVVNPPLAEVGIYLCILAALVAIF